MNETAMRLFSALLIFVCCQGSFAQTLQPDSTIITRLLRDIKEEQVTAGGGEFYAGSFPTRRHFAGFPPNNRPDNSIFFTGLISFTLQSVTNSFSAPQLQLALQVLQNAEQAYTYFQNKDGKPLYFFWPRGKPIMPHTLLAQHLTSHISTAEDADDTVLILMGLLNQNDSINRLAKNLIDSFANTRFRNNKSTFKKYSGVPAYNTYLGKKMHSDFDLCVHTNVLYFALANNIPLNRYDSATIHLASSMLSNQEHLRQGAYIAPYYVRRPVILYHLARLMGRFDIPALNNYKPQLVAQLYNELALCKIPMDKVILHTSLLRLGQKPAPLVINSIETFTRQDDRFIFYQARAGSQMANPFKQVFLNCNRLNYYFYCTAYNKALLLEYVVERNRTR
ncbi:hypothetical protein [Foetidibacter luteolus]|uniref:hypothetical protein n=1 Tax=Foetidibacter luteolus TaxID=2608880 RepID=UPI00129AB939|nr:hypothetical protein [Foetidibacter luteolus]